MNNKTVAILIGVGVLLYLWKIGAFKRKESIPPATTKPLENADYFDKSSTKVIPSPQDNAHPALWQASDLSSTDFDNRAGVDFREKVGMSGGRDFGQVRLS